MKPSDLRKLNTRAAYPWPLGEPMPDDVTGMATDEIIYGASQIADPYPDEGNEQ